MFNKSRGIKRVVSISAAALCMMSALNFAPLNDKQVVDAADIKTAFEITEDMQIGWNYGNSLDATGGSGLDTETSWGNPKATQEMMDAVKAKGFNTVRLPTTWYPHLDADNNIDPAWMARVHEIVDYAYNNDMYVILNVHHEEWINRADLGTAYDEMSVKLKAVWKQIAEEFKDYDQHLIFEGMNEPRAKDTDHEWWGPTQDEVDCINKLNQDFVDTVRSVESPYKDTRLLMCPPYCATSDSGMMSTLVLPEDDYVAASIHAYSPYGFTMDKTVEDHSTFSEAYATELETILNGIRKQFIEKDIPVVLGEFSASNFNNTEARCEWAKTYITLMKGYGIPCILWDNDARGNSDQSEAHDYLNRDTLEWYEDSGQVIDAMMEVLADTSIKWGSQKYGKQYNHEDISKGKQIIDSSISLDSSVENGNCTPGLNVSWKDLEGKDIAIKFTGDAPIVAVVNGEWKNWTEIQAYDIDEKNGIAYYSSKTIESAWSGDASEIEHLFARTNGKTTIESISLITAAEEVEQPEDPEIPTYDVDFANRGTSNTMTITFTGKAGTTANGCVGYMNGEDWEAIKWDGTVGSDGTLTVEVDITDIPSSVSKGQIQLWWSDTELEFKNYNFVGGGQSTTTTTNTTSTGTSTTTTTTTTTATDKPTSNPDIVYGDANGDGIVTIADAVMIMQSLANSDEYTLSEKGAEAADVVGNDGITSKDALAIQMVVAGTISADSLPLENID